MTAFVIQVLGVASLASAWILMLIEVMKGLDKGVYNEQAFIACALLGLGGVLAAIIGSIIAWLFRDKSDDDKEEEYIVTCDQCGRAIGYEFGENRPSGNEMKCITCRAVDPPKTTQG